MKKNLIKWELFPKYCSFLFSCFALIILIPGLSIGEGWSDFKILLLSDDSFAVVESSKYVTNTRHCPHHDVNGKLDEKQLIWVLGNFDTEEWHDLNNREVARKHLEAHYDQFMNKVMKEDLKIKMNINTMELTDLVALPGIGPVLAVKIAKHRDAYGQFESIEDIKKVEGIGQGTFNAIRHYISINP